VIMGGRSAGSRDREMAALLDQGFAEVGGSAMVARGETPAMPQQVVVAEPPLLAPDPPPPEPRKTALISKAARKLVGHLSPVGKAEAAPISHHLRAESATERWSIQLGAFRVETAAEQAARSAASLPVARGKPLQIVQPSKGGKDRLYRARLLNFTPEEAQSACAALHKKKIVCSVVPPTAIRVAGR
jgi:D-alanyl-D-alanine carboxypeptidase